VSTDEELSTKLPVAVVLSVDVDRRGVRTVTVVCPYRCRARRHVHGFPTGDIEIGHRVAHCPTGDRPVGLEYWVPVPALAGGNR
jgi:hypothetical protein